MSTTANLLTWLAPAQAEMLDLLRAWCEHETPSSDLTAVRALALRVADDFQADGCRARVFGDALEILRAGADPGAKPILVLGHLDTVYPVGTLRAMPFRVDAEAGVVRGPGVYDMKAGIVQALFALRVCRPARPVVIRLVFDEETGSRASRPATEARARESAAALVLEPGADADGKLKTARKGIAVYTLRARGRAAHAGVDFGQGASAVVEIAHQIGAAAAMCDAEKGLTLNPGVVRGGTAVNVVAAEASVELEARAWTRAELDRTDQRLRRLEARNPDVELELAGGVNRPPMEASPRSLELATLAQSLGREIGLELGTARTGGGSDGNFTAAAGCPTLDGLGMAGGGAHSPGEHFRLDQLVPRTALLAALLQRL